MTYRGSWCPRPESNWRFLVYQTSVFPLDYPGMVLSTGLEPVTARVGTGCTIHPCYESSLLSFRIFPPISSAEGRAPSMAVRAYDLALLDLSLHLTQRVPAPAKSRDGPLLVVINMVELQYQGVSLPAVGTGVSLQVAEEPGSLLLGTFGLELSCCLAVVVPVPGIPLLSGLFPTRLALSLKPVPLCSVLSEVRQRLLFPASSTYLHDS